jgi:hypothetical protein
MISDIKRKSLPAIAKIAGIGQSNLYIISLQNFLASPRLEITEIKHYLKYYKAEKLT